MQCVSSLVLCTVILADYCLVWLSFVWPGQSISSSVLCAVVGYGEPADPHTSTVTFEARSSLCCVLECRRSGIFAMQMHA